MAEDGIDRNALRDRLRGAAVSEQDPLKAIAECVAQFLTQANVETKVGAKPRRDTSSREQRALSFTLRNGTHPHACLT